MDGCPVPSLLICWYTKPLHLMFPTPFLRSIGAVHLHWPFPIPILSGTQVEETNRPFPVPQTRAGVVRLLEKMARYIFLGIILIH